MGLLEWTGCDVWRSRICPHTVIRPALGAGQAIGCAQSIGPVAASTGASGAVSGVSGGDPSGADREVWWQAASKKAQARIDRMR
jgi:hypothetical protein